MMTYGISGSEISEALQSLTLLTEFLIQCSNLWSFIKRMYQREKRFHVYSEENAFYGSKSKIIDGNTIYQECGIANCFSCDQSRIYCTTWRDIGDPKLAN